MRAAAPRTQFNVLSFQHLITLVPFNDGNIWQLTNGGTNEKFYDLQIGGNTMN